MAVSKGSEVNNIDTISAAVLFPTYARLHVPNRHIVPPNMSRAFYTAGTVCGFD
jgi:hypothetical protein